MTDKAKIGVISDTHLTQSPPPRDLSRAVDRAFENIDTVIHAGDLVNLEAVDMLLAPRKLIAVRGNMDPPGTDSGALPPKRLFEHEGVRVGVFHGNGPPGGLVRLVTEAFEGDDADVIVFGHSHHPMNQRRGGVLYFNPGSATGPRRGGSATVGVLTFENSGVEGSIVELKP